MSDNNKLNNITDYLDNTFSVKTTADSSLNGFQIEGSEIVTKIGCAVDFSEDAIKLALGQNCDLLIIHHGLFWESPLSIRGSVKRLIKTCLDNGLSVYALHLPLDAHPKFGNNFGLARLLELESLYEEYPYRGTKIGCIGQNKIGHSLEKYRDILLTLPGAPDTKFQFLPFGDKTPKRVAVISGGAAQELTHCHHFGVDTFISGEPKQFVYHYAKENGLNAIFAGHYATETVGVRLLGEHLTSQFGIPHAFLHIPTGI